MARTFTCDNCGKTFESERSDEEALAEMKENFAGLQPESRAIVCDDCYQALMLEMTN